MPVTFGAVGDIIAVGALIKGLIMASNSTRGSQAEYRTLVNELHSLDQVFSQILLLLGSLDGLPMNLQGSANNLSSTSGGKSRDTQVHCPREVLRATRFRLLLQNSDGG